VDLEQGPLSLTSTTEELLGRKNSGSGPKKKKQEYNRRNPSGWPRDTFYPQNLVLTSPTIGGHSVGIVHSRTQTTEFLYLPLFDVLTANLSCRIVGYTQMFSMYYEGLITKSLQVRRQTVISCYGQVVMNCLYS
jgi:hypothetical protein